MYKKKTYEKKMYFSQSWPLGYISCANLLLYLIKKTSFKGKQLYFVHMKLCVWGMKLKDLFYLFIFLTIPSMLDIYSIYDYIWWIFHQLVTFNGKYAKKDSTEMQKCKFNRKIAVFFPLASIRKWAFLADMTQNLKLYHFKEYGTWHLSTTHTE